MVFRCKICGANLEADEKSAIVACTSCDTSQTFPKLSDDARTNLFDRANHFRRNNDYDKVPVISALMFRTSPKTFNSVKMFGISLWH